LSSSSIVSAPERHPWRAHPRGECRRVDSAGPLSCRRQGEVTRGEDDPQLLFSGHRRARLTAGSTLGPTRGQGEQHDHGDCEDAQRSHAALTRRCVTLASARIVPSVVSHQGELKPAPGVSIMESLVRADRPRSGAPRPVPNHAACSALAVRRRLSVFRPSELIGRTLEHLFSVAKGWRHVLLAITVEPRPRCCLQRWRGLPR